MSSFFYLQHVIYPFKYCFSMFDLILWRLVVKFSPKPVELENSDQAMESGIGLLGSESQFCIS